MHEAYTAFLKWLGDNGAYFHPDSALGTGVYANDHLHAGTEILKIPRSMIIHPRACFEKLNELDENGFCYQDLTPRQWLILYLLIHRICQESSCPSSDLQRIAHHGPYVQLISTTFLTPVGFSRSEIQLLEGTSLHSATIQRIDSLNESAYNVQQWLMHQTVKHPNDALQALFQFSKTEEWKRFWHWADTAYASRSFPPMVGGWPADDEPILIPGFDALNHKRGEPVTWSFESPDMAVFTTRQEYSSNEQVFNNYGAKSNEELLMTYGFIEPGGPDDVLVLALRSDPEQPQSVHYWRRPDPAPPASLLEQCRRITTKSHEDLVSVLLAEVDVIEAIERVLRQKRKLFKRTQTDVEDAIPFEDSTDCIRAPVLAMIQEYRKGQAWLLNRGLEWSQTRLDELLDQLEQHGWTP